jgi:hypothetical protein
MLIHYSKHNLTLKSLIIFNNKKSVLKRSLIFCLPKLSFTSTDLIQEKFSEFLITNRFDIFGFYHLVHCKIITNTTAFLKVNCILF